MSEDGGDERGAPSPTGRGGPDGKDFSGVDLRGADFTGADLRGATFERARLGVPVHVGIVLLALGLLVAVACGVAIGWAVDEMRSQLSADEWDEVAGGGSLLATVALLLGLTIWKGAWLALRVVVAFWVVVVVTNVAANLIWEDVEWVSVLRATVLVVFVVLAILAGVVGRVVGGVFGMWSILLVAAIGGLATGQAEGGLAGILVAMSLAFISRRAISGDDRDRHVRVAGHRLVRRWGTRFVDADLTGADFTGADPRGCDTRGAILDDVVWDPDNPRPLNATT